MTQMMQRVFALGLFSHVMAFSAMFLMASSPFHGGTAYVTSFFPTAQLLATVTFFGARKAAGDTGTGMIVSQVLILMAGLGSTLRVESDQRLILMGIFLAFQILLMRRLYSMVDDMSYIRRALYEQFHVDMRLLVLLCIPATFWPINQDWQFMVLPFLCGFILMRMMALSTASRMTKHVEDAPQTRTLAEKWQGKMPLLLVVAALLGGWMLSVMGVPVLSVLKTVLMPIVYAIGWLIGLVLDSHVLNDLADLLRAIAQWLSEIYAWILCTLFGLCEMQDLELLPAEEIIDQDIEGKGSELTWLVGTLTTAAVSYALYRFFRNRKTGRLQMVDGAIEIREFIHDDNNTNQGHVRNIGLFHARTRMRKVYRKFLLSMKKQGYVRGEGETALEYIQKIATDRPEMRGLMRELTDYYMQERYGGKKVDDKLSRSEQLAQEIHKKK